MKLSVVIPNRNDTVMLSVTVKSALECLKSIDNDGEIIVVDNSDEPLWNLIKTVNKSPLALHDVREGRVKLIRQDFPGLYSAVQKGTEIAEGEYWYRADSHTLFGHNHFKDLVEFMDSGTDNKVGCGFSPLGWIRQHERFARHDIRFDRDRIFDNWGRQYYEPTKICWNFGSRICSLDWWKTIGGYGFFADKQIGWGGGEFYVAIKSWLMGRENWAIPTSPQYHIGPFSDEILRLTTYRYHQYGKSGTTSTGMGILCAFYALGGDAAKEELLKSQASIRKNYAIEIEERWPEAKEIAHDAYEQLKQVQAMSFEQFLKDKPWEDNWPYKDRWTSWTPNDDIPKNFDLKRL